jgi:hypothetical protein
MSHTIRIFPPATTGLGRVLRSQAKYLGVSAPAICTLDGDYCSSHCPWIRSDDNVPLGMKPRRGCHAFEQPLEYTSGGRSHKPKLKRLSICKSFEVNGI